MGTEVSGPRRAPDPEVSMHRTATAPHQVRAARSLPRLAVGCALTVTLAAAGLSLAPAERAGAAPPRHLERARAAYDAMQQHFYDPDHGLYRETYPPTGDNPWSYAWPFSQAMVATQDMAGLPGRGGRYADDVAARYTALEGYWNASTDPPGYDSYLRPPLGQGGDKFYDDNEWIGLAFVQRHLMADGGEPSGDPAALHRAQQIFDLVVYGWDDDADHPCPGGVYWTQADWSNDRNTVSNGPGAELGLHLYLATGDRHDLAWAKRMYEWTRGCLLAPNQLYWDNIGLDGSIDKTQWSYNQGVMIGAGVLLYRATGDRTYLAQAQQTAQAALAYYGRDDRYFDQPARFNAIFFANLLQLDAVDHDPAYRKAMENYADAAHRRAFDATTGLYRFEPGEPVTLLEQAGMVRIESMLAWSPKDYGKLT